MIAFKSDVIRNTISRMEASRTENAAKLAAEIKKKQDRDEQLADEDRVFSRAKQGLDAKTNAQSRLQSENSSSQSSLQRERSEQSLRSQREGVDGNSRLQSERASQSLTSQKEGVEGNSRLQKERSEQSLTSQREGTEGQSRLQREGFEGRGKLQSQTAAEANARKAGDRAASMSLFRKFGKGR